MVVIGNLLEGCHLSAQIRLELEQNMNVWTALSASPFDEGLGLGLLLSVTTISGSPGVEFNHS